MENIFSFDVFLINVPIYIAFILAGFMLAIKPKRDKKNRLDSVSNELYNSQEDLKVESFEDYDNYLKIASMFRKNGEFDKAVQIHQKMLESQGLTKQHESKVIFELGEDFLASGLFDKAEENLLTALKIIEKNSEQEKECFLAISRLYERQVNWEKAVVYRKKLAENDTAHNSGLALLLCNLAEVELKNKNIGNAKQYYSEALVYDKNCVLAVKELSSIHFDEKNLDDSFTILEEYIEQSTKLLNLLVPTLISFINNKDYKAKTIKLIEKIINEKTCDHEVFVLYCQYLLEEKKLEELSKSISHYYETHKNNLHAVYAMALFLKESKFNYDSKDHNNVLFEKIEKMLKDEYSYQCGSCGYHTKQEFWYCPQCQKWDTIDRAHR